MKELEVGDRVIRADDQQISVGVITKIHRDGNLRYKIAGPGWQNSLWTHDFIVKYEFKIGAIVLPKNSKDDHGHLGKVVAIGGTGSMIISGLTSDDTSYWSGSYTASYLRILESYFEAEDVTSCMLKLYLA